VRLVPFRLRPRPAPASVLGRRGEDAAVAALRRAGYRVIGRNVRTPAGEADVVALDGETLVLVEVKATGVARGGGPGPERRVDRAKRARLRGVLARIAVRRAFARHARRFDVVAVRMDGRSPACTILRGGFRGRP
jgi:putative endonuclease